MQNPTPHKTENYSSEQKNSPVRWNGRRRHVKKWEAEWLLKRCSWRWDWRFWETGEPGNNKSMALPKPRVTAVALDKCAQSMCRGKGTASPWLPFLPNEARNSFFSFSLFFPFPQSFLYRPGLSQPYSVVQTIKTIIILIPQPLWYCDY